MADKKKAMTDEELNAMFNDLPDDSSNKDSTTAPLTNNNSYVSEDDPLAELTMLAAPRPSSRPSTPRIRRDPGAASVSSRQVSEDRHHNVPLRRSGESTRSPHQSYTPASSNDEMQQPISQDTPKRAVQAPTAPSSHSREPKQSKQSGSSGWGGWFSGLTATATAAVKQAEAAVKEIQKNEEAQRWATQVRGNIYSLQGLGHDLKSRAIPSFTHLLEMVAPPISAHERLAIHITHDILNYPSLDPLIYAVFSRCMSQVEGGDLIVIQRGSESSPNKHYTGGTGGWSDGPWWRDSSRKRDLGMVKGLVEGTKLCRVSAESYGNEFFSSKGGVEAAAQRATETLSQENPTRSSDIFLAIQAVGYDAPFNLFATGSAEKSEESKGTVEEVQDKDEMVAFAVYLHDPIHSISFAGLSQPVPLRWVKWLDAESSPAVEEAIQDTEKEALVDEERLPPEIQEIIQTGGIDPREWVAEWLEECLVLAVGVLSQRYVARRMGVGEGGLGRGKRRAEAVEGGAGEAARAI